MLKGYMARVSLGTPSLDPRSGHKRRKGMGGQPPRFSNFLEKKVVFLVSSEKKTNLTTFVPP